MLADKVGDADFMSSFDMNKRPMLVLLERGYIQRSLEEEVPPKYAPSSRRCSRARSRRWAPSSRASQPDRADVAGRLPAREVDGGARAAPLIEPPPDHDVLLLSGGEGADQPLSGNLVAKDSIVNEGGVRSIIPHLLNKPQEITRAFCVLLKNCLTAPELRDRVVNDGAVSPIVKLLHRSEIIGAQRSPATVAAAASALWNLSAHEGAKKMVIREKGVEALVMQLNEAEDRDAWQKCAGCLMVLAANSQQVKHLVGDEDGIRALCEIVNESHRRRRPRPRSARSPSSRPTSATSPTCAPRASSRSASASSPAATRRARRRTGCSSSPRRSTTGWRAIRYPWHTNNKSGYPTSVHAIHHLTLATVAILHIAGRLCRTHTCRASYPRAPLRAYRVSAPRDAAAPSA